MALPARIPELDLQEALDTVHRLYRYDRLVNYTQAPPTPLSPEEAAWVEERLRQAGRRT